MSKETTPGVSYADAAGSAPAEGAPPEAAPAGAEEGGLASLHRIDIFNNALQDAEATGKDKNEVILSTLKSMNITVHILESTSEDITEDLEDVVYSAIKVAAQNDPDDPTTSIEQVCLYRDYQGRLVNLVIASYAVGPSGTFYAYKDSFSGLQAMVATVMLSRSLPCAFLDEILMLKQRYITLLLGLVLNEEISLSWMNSAMYLRGLPSVSAYTLTHRVGSDFLRKLLIFILIAAGAASPKGQFVMTMIGILLAILIFLANLGSRAWHFMKFRPIQYHGPFANYFAFFAAVTAGLFIPYMGHREMMAGGKRSLEQVLSTAFWVAVIFIVTGLESVPDIFVMGSEVCPQGAIDITIGVWWLLTMSFGMYLALQIKQYEPKPEEDEDVFLIKTDESPVGYKVPNLPDFTLDPVAMDKGSPHVSLQFEVAFGVLMAIGLGFGIIFEGAKLASQGQ